MRRESLSWLPWRTYSSAKAKPEELRFDVLDGKERVVGQIAYTRVALSLTKWREGSVMSTPWGEGIIQPETGQYRMSMDGNELFLIKETGSALNKKGIVLIAPNGAKLDFKHTGSYPCRGLEYSDSRGYIAVLEEHGRLTERMGGRPASLTKEEIKTLSKEDRPTSIESLHYVQYRFKADGAFPVRLEDVIAAMFMWVSDDILIEEITDSTAPC